MTIPMYSTFNVYFVEKRALMMNITKALIGFATMCYPILVEFLMTMYGFRGSLTVIAAIHAHVILAMMVLHPVEWHLRKINSSINDKSN